MDECWVLRSRVGGTDGRSCCTAESHKVQVVFDGSAGVRMLEMPGLCDPEESCSERE